MPPPACQDSFHPRRLQCVQHLYVYLDTWEWRVTATRFCVIPEVGLSLHRSQVPALLTVCTTFPELARNIIIQWPHTLLTTIYTRSWAALRGWDPPPNDRSNICSLIRVRERPDNRYSICTVQSKEMSERPYMVWWYTPQSEYFTRDETRSLYQPTQLERTLQLY
jgi:hypothetical protein